MVFQNGPSVRLELTNARHDTRPLPEIEQADETLPALVFFQY